MHSLNEIQISKHRLSNALRWSVLGINSSAGKMALKGGASIKKTVFFGNFSQMADPPTPPPLLGTP